MCTPFSTSGNLEGEVDPNMESHHVYCAAVDALGGNLDFLENVPGFSVNLWVKGRHPKKTVYCCFGSEDLGVCGLRPRLIYIYILYIYIYVYMKTNCPKGPCLKEGLLRALYIQRGHA